METNRAPFLRPGLLLLVLLCAPAASVRAQQAVAAAVRSAAGARLGAAGVGAVRLSPPDVRLAAPALAPLSAAPGPAALPAVLPQGAPAAASAGSVPSAAAKASGVRVRRAKGVPALEAAVPAGGAEEAVTAGAAGVLAALESADAGVRRDGGRRADRELSKAFDGEESRRHRAPEGTGGVVDLGAVDTSDTGPFDKDQEKKALKRLRKDQEALDELQQMLYARGAKSVLIVLQAMDTAGKDGTIRHVLTSLNPQGIKVTPFKKPTEEEARHGWMWRIRNALPGKGVIGVFNRSHYEDILVPTVYKTLPASEVDKRYEEINRFERELAENGVVVLKFFLHISKAEQKRRLQERLDNPKKRWKFSPSDLPTREKWDDFQKAYGEVLARTSTEWAPWFIIPSDRKWYRNSAVGRILLEAMSRMGLSFPEPTFDPKKVKIPD